MSATGMLLTMVKTIAGLPTSGSSCCGPITSEAAGAGASGAAASAGSCGEGGCCTGPADTTDRDDPRTAASATRIGWPKRVDDAGLV